MSTTQLSCTLFMGSCGNMRPPVGIIYGLTKKTIMPESSALARILAYMADNRLKADLEIVSQPRMFVEEKIVETVKIQKIGLNGQETALESRMLDASMTMSLWGLRKTQ